MVNLSFSFRTPSTSSYLLVGVRKTIQNSHFQNHEGISFCDGMVLGEVENICGLSTVFCLESSLSGIWLHN